jgi:ferredoxin
MAEEGSAPDGAEPPRYSGPTNKQPNKPESNVLKQTPKLVMAQIFHRVPIRFLGSHFRCGSSSASLSTVVGVFIQSPYFSEAQVVREQSAPFSHKHHVSGIGIDCMCIGVQCTTCHGRFEQMPMSGKQPAVSTQTLAWLHAFRRGWTLKGQCHGIADWIA